MKNEITVTGRKLAISEATKKRNPHLFPLAGLGSPEPQHREVQTLARGVPEQTECQKGMGQVHVLLVRYGRRKLDDDNNVAASKALRDAIAESIGIDDGDPQISWHYDQIISKTTGTHVLITMTDQQTKGQTGTKGI